jgi:hypothetical protein
MPAPAVRWPYGMVALHLEAWGPVSPIDLLIIPHELHVVCYERLDNSIKLDFV